MDGTFGYELFVQEIAPSSSAVLNLANLPVITWPASLANYQVQSSDSLTSPNWTAVTNAPALVNGQNTVVLTPGGAQTFSGFIACNDRRRNFGRPNMRPRGKNAHFP